ncbi:MAG: hypothetical protein ACYTGL_22625 [Planctomycetota bacterium]|jgi:hypothetical protein
MKNTDTTRREWLRSTTAWGLSGLAMNGGAAQVLRADSETMLDVGSQTQLFCDDLLIDSKDGVRHRLHQPRKANDGQPVLLLDQPWEELGTPILGTVLRDNGRFRLWYRGGGRGPTGGIWCYAESDDGLAWKKPSLGLLEHEGSRANNIYVIGQPQAFTPFVDPNEDDPTRRYKSAINSPRIDTALASSRDGLRWKAYRQGAAITGRASDTISQVLWDPFAEVYRLYTRTDYGTARTGEVRGTRDMVAAADSDLSDPASWHTVREWCLGWERGDSDYHRQRQLYSVNGFVHAGVQFALIWTLETGDGETMNARLATTRGDRPWDLRWTYGDQPLIPRGEPGRFDCHWIQPAPGIVTWKDRHWLYYVGLARTHAGQWSPKLTGPKGGIGLATIRRDGFISVYAGPQEGTLTTRPLKFDGKRLAINAVTTATGSVRVEIQNAAGQPLRGFSLADCTPFNGDDLNGIIRWNNNSTINSLAGQTVRLRFVMKDADVYAFRFTTETRTQ